MILRRLWEFITALLDVLGRLWECITAGLDSLAEALKPERIQEPAPPDDPDNDPETVSEGSRRNG